MKKYLPIICCILLGLMISSYSLAALLSPPQVQFTPYPNMKCKTVTGTGKSGGNFQNFTAVPFATVRYQGYLNDGKTTTLSYVKRFNNGSTASTGNYFIEQSGTMNTNTGVKKYVFGLMSTAYGTYKMCVETDQGF